MQVQGIDRLLGPTKRQAFVCHVPPMPPTMQCGTQSGKLATCEKEYRPTSIGVYVASFSSELFLASLRFRISLLSEAQTPVTVVAMPTTTTPSGDPNSGVRLARPKSGGRKRQEGHRFPGHCRPARDPKQRHTQGGVGGCACCMAEFRHLLPLVGGSSAGS